MVQITNYDILPVEGIVRFARSNGCLTGNKRFTVADDQTIDVDYDGICTVEAVSGRRVGTTKFCSDYMTVSVRHIKDFAIITTPILTTPMGQEFENDDANCKITTRGQVKISNDYSSKFEGIVEFDTDDCDKSAVDREFEIDSNQYAIVYYFGTCYVKEIFGDICEYEGITDKKEFKIVAQQGDD